MNFKGQLLEFSTPKIMGILNVTPDSFFEGSRISAIDDLLRQAEKMLSEGATILDVGGVSTRPGAADVTVEAELERVIPAISALKQNFPQALLSIDTFNAVVADEALKAGGDMINDISGLSMDAGLIDVVAKWNVPYVLMHMQGTPKTMQQNPVYKDVLTEVFDFFVQKIELLRNRGVKDIVLDPGFGFGKSIAHNYTLLNHMAVFHKLDCPLLAGISRKSMIWKTLDITAKAALNGTTALHLRALDQGANILRVHDVKEAAEVIELWTILEKYK